MRWTLIFSIIIILGFYAKAHAHRVNVYAYAEAGKVYVEGYFVDGTKAKSSKIEVFREDTGKLILTGVTDEDGKYSFKIPGPYSLRIVLKASMGHKNEYLLEKEEIMEALGMQTKPPQVKVASKVTEPQGANTVVSSDIETILEKHLKPLREEIVKLRIAMERPRMSEVIGGLGYIMGIVGIYLYIKSRQG